MIAFAATGLREFKWQIRVNLGRSFFRDITSTLPSLHLMSLGFLDK
jgi:hypothetical protein